MITISVYRNGEGNIDKFVVKGHANVADSGEDIVCAAVSVLTQTTVLSLCEIANIAINYKIKSGYLKCNLPSDLTEKERYDTKLLINTMFLGLKNIRESYSEYIKIFDEEV